MDLGERIAVLREEQALTQADLAEVARISPSTLSQIESGRVPRPHVGTVRKIARALGVEPADLRRAKELALPKADAPEEAGRLPGWATTSDINILNQNVSEVPSEELHNLVKLLAQNLRWNRTLEGVRSEPRSESHARVLNLSRTNAIVEELRRRGEEPPEEYLMAHRQWLKAMAPPSEAEPQSDTGRNIPETG